jgi:hypothetical protein
MNSEQTKENQENSQIPNDWSPTSARMKRKSSEPMSEETEAEFQKMFQESITGGDNPAPDANNDNESTVANDATIRQEDRNDTSDSLQTQFTESTGDTRSTQSKRVSGKQRKESLEEYRKTFLSVPS